MGWAVLQLIEPPFGFYGYQRIVTVKTEDGRRNHRHWQREQRQSAGFIDGDSGYIGGAILSAICGARKIVRLYLKLLLDIGCMRPDRNALVNSLANKMRVKPDPCQEQNHKVTTGYNKRIMFPLVHALYNRG